MALFLKCCKNQKRGASPYGKCLPARLSRGARILGTLSFASRLLSDDDGEDDDSAFDDDDAGDNDDDDDGDDED